MKGDDLAIATHGRGFWILDDLSVFRQPDVGKPTATKLFKPEPARRWSGRWANSGNAPGGMVVRYRLEKPANKITVNIKDRTGEVIKSFGPDDKNFTNRAGLNTVVWNLRYPNARRVPRVVTRGNQEVGPKAVPGEYLVEIDIDGDVFRETAIVEKDPRVSVSDRELQAQFDFLVKIRDKIDRINETVLYVRAINEQIDALGEIEVSGTQVAINSGALKIALQKIEQRLVQVNANSRKDLHANPVMLNDKFYSLANFAERVDAKPTPTQLLMYEEFSEVLDEVFITFEMLVSNELPTLNSMLADQGLAEITMKIDNSGVAATVQSTSMPR